MPIKVSVVVPVYNPGECTEDRLAAEHPHMRDIHQEPSGWSGKPRNAAIAAALSEFIQFETRLGSVRGGQARRGRGAALIGSPPHLVLPYWTGPHGNLSLDVDQQTKRISHEFAGLSPADVAVTADPGRLTVALPLHVPGETEVTLTPTDAAGNSAVRVPATQTARAAGPARPVAARPTKQPNRASEETTYATTGH